MATPRSTSAASESCSELSSVSGTAVLALVLLPAAVLVEEKIEEVGNVDDPMDAEAELPEPSMLSDFPEAVEVEDDDDELFVGDSDRRVELLRERLTGQEAELARMRRAWRQRETALRKADGHLRQKDVDLERLRHDYERLKQELETVEVQGRNDLESSEALRAEQSKALEKIGGETVKADSSLVQE